MAFVSGKHTIKGEPVLVAGAGDVIAFQNLSGFSDIRYWFGSDNKENWHILKALELKNINCTDDLWVWTRDDIEIDIATTDTFELVSGGGSGEAPATDTKLQAVIDAIIASDDDTQLLLTSSINESDDTQSLITALDTSNSNDAIAIKDAITGLDSAQSTRLGDILTKIGLEGDETQNSIGLMVTNISALTSQNLAESNETQGILNQLKDFFFGFASEEVLSSDAYTQDHVVPAGNKRILVINTGTTDVFVRGNIPVKPNGTYADQAGIFARLPEHPITGSNFIVSVASKNANTGGL